MDNKELLGLPFDLLALKSELNECNNNCPDRSCAYDWLYRRASVRECRAVFGCAKDCKTPQGYQASECYD